MLRLLSQQDIERAVPMAAAIEVVKGAFAQLSAGRAAVPPRAHLEVPEHQGVVLVMSAYLPETPGLCLKAISIYPANAALGLPTVSALVVALDTATGRPVALLEGAYLTALRTGAATGAATQLLARPDAQVLALFGAGAQARTQLQAAGEVRDIREVRVCTCHPEHAARFAAEMAGRGRLPTNIRPALNPAEAVRGADIIITATTSPTPVFDGCDLSPGTHINAIGAFTPHAREVDELTVQKAKIVVDSRLACLAEAGDILIPLRQGLIGSEAIHAELGEIILGRRPGRESREEITLFKAVGNAVQDAAVAAWALRVATQQDLGTLVEL